MQDQALKLSVSILVYLAPSSCDAGYELTEFNSLQKADQSLCSVIFFPAQEDKLMSVNKGFELIYQYVYFGCARKSVPLIRKLLKDSFKQPFKSRYLGRA